jgi:hypothetical protein
MPISAKEYLKKFFQKTFSEYTFERMIIFKNSIVEFNYTEDSFETFVQYNLQCIDELDSSDANCYAKLCKNIADKKIMLCDEESCVEFEAYTFYFNYQKEFVIMNPR